MKKLLSIILLLVMVCCVQPVEAQDIIMGTTSFVGTIDDQPRYFYDPGGTGYFAQGLCDTITLRTNYVNTRLYVLFEEFAMGDGDTLWVFDGDASQCDIDHLLGYYNLMNFPRELCALGRDMTFVFHSDSMDIPGLQDGWKAQVYAIDSQPMEVNYGEWTSVVTCNAVFYDAGGPNGTINANGTPQNSFTEFISPIGTHIKCQFTEFSVGGVLKIYDGHYFDTNKRLIGQFCTSTLDSSTNNMPPVLFSSTNTLSFEYISGTGDENKAGWEAYISCVPELVEYEEGSPCLGISNKLIGDYAGADDTGVVELDALHSTVMIQALVNASGQYANDYQVEQIPYDENAMLFGYNEGISINANSDDEWLAPVNLPFPFNFFGNIYTALYPSSDGVVSFDPHVQHSHCEWNTANYVPTPSPPYPNTPYCYTNSAYLLYEDGNPNPYSCSANGSIKTGVLGNPPCRAFVFNHHNIGLYSCCVQGSYMYNTYQMVMYEGSGIIDVYIKHRASCISWNGGRGVIGLQNKTSSQIVTPLGRNFGTTDAPIVWSADNEAWRFTPITPPDENGELTWYKDIVDENHVISHGFQRQNRVIAVAPTETTSYISEYKFTNGVGELYILRDTTLVLVPEPIDSTGVAVRGADFTVYPNPTHDAVYVKMQEGRSLPARFEVLDLRGRQLFAVPAQETTRVDLSRLPSGVYLLKASDGGRGSAVKITKQ